MISEGFKFRKCVKCGINFAHLSDTLYCGDLSCNEEDLEFKKVPNGGLELFDSFKELRDDFEKYFRKNHLNMASKVETLDRMPTLLRYTTTNMKFLTAGISSFEALKDIDNPRLKAHSDKLFISMPYCYRFTDRENVNKTNRHNIGFFMFSLHCFEDKNHLFKENWKEVCFSTFFDYFLYLGIPIKNLYVTEDKWDDTKDFGHSKEIYINGMEIANMVFTDMTMEEGVLKPRKLRYLDMGLGGQRLDLLTRKKGASDLLLKDPLLNDLRAIFISLKDKIYPSKVSIGYNIRLIYESVINKKLSDTELDKKIDIVVSHLESITSQNYAFLKEDFWSLYGQEFNRVLKKG